MNIWRLKFALLAVILIPPMSTAAVFGIKPKQNKSVSNLRSGGLWDARKAALLMTTGDSAAWAVIFAMFITLILYYLEHGR